MHLGLYPVHRKRDQPHPFVRVKALDCLHEANVALLDQISLSQTVTGIAAGNMYDEAKMREHQLSRRVNALLVKQALCQLALPLGGQHSNATHRLNIGGQIGAGRHIQHCTVRQRQCTRCIGHVSRLQKARGRVF